MTPSTYTINAIKPNGSVDVTFSIDGKKQNISRLHVEDADALTDALNDYAIAYAAGLEVQAVDPVPAEVTALVGKAQEVVVEAPTDTVVTPEDAPTK